MYMGSRKKSFFLVDSPLRGVGERVRGCQLGKKYLFKDFSGLSAKKNFFAASLSDTAKRLQPIKKSND